MHPAPAPRTSHQSDGSSGVTRLRPRPELDRLFDALADVDRLRLVEELDVCGGAAAQLGSTAAWTRDAAAKQLKLLERAGLVAGGRIGRRVHYTRTSATLVVALGWSSALWRQLPTTRLEHAEVLDLERRAVLAGAFRAAGRRDMLECMCRGGPIAQGAATRDCDLSQGLASRGLAQLVEVGLVNLGTTRPPHRYTASPETMAAVVGWLRKAAEAAARAEAQGRRLQEAHVARAAERLKEEGFVDVRQANDWPATSCDRRRSKTSGGGRKGRKPSSPLVGSRPRGRS